MEVTWPNIWATLLAKFHRKQIEKYTRKHKSSFKFLNLQLVNYLCIINFKK